MWTLSHIKHDFHNNQYFPASVWAGSYPTLKNFVVELDDSTFPEFITQMLTLIDHHHTIDSSRTRSSSHCRLSSHRPSPHTHFRRYVVPHRIDNTYVTTTTYHTYDSHHTDYAHRTTESYQNHEYYRTNKNRANNNSHHIYDNHLPHDTAHINDSLNIT